MSQENDALDRDLDAAFERKLRSQAFRSEIIEWIDADSERAERTMILARELREVAKSVFTRPHA